LFRPGSAKRGWCWWPISTKGHESENLCSLARPIGHYGVSHCGYGVSPCRRAVDVLDCSSSVGLPCGRYSLRHCIFRARRWWIVANLATSSSWGQISACTYARTDPIHLLGNSKAERCECGPDVDKDRMENLMRRLPRTLAEYGSTQKEADRLCTLTPSLGPCET
jgi:hypothetical protein